MTGMLWKQSYMHTCIMQTDTGSLFLAKCKSRKEPAGLNISSVSQTIQKGKTNMARLDFGVWTLASCAGTHHWRCIQPY